MAGFTEENDFLDIFSLQNIVDLGEVFVAGLIATTDNDDDIIARERVDGHTGGAGVGRKIIIVVSDAAKLTDEFEAMGKAFKTG